MHARTNARTYIHTEYSKRKGSPKVCTLVVPKIHFYIEIKTKGIISDDLNKCYSEHDSKQHSRSLAVNQTPYNANSSGTVPFKSSNSKCTS